MPLNPKQNAFVAEYLVDLNATKAAERAGYPKKSARSKGAQLLANVNVRKAVDEALARRSKRVEVSQDDVLRVLVRNLNFDPASVYNEHGSLMNVTEMPVEARLAIQSLEWGEHGPKVKFWSKDKALELGMRHLGLLKDKVEHSLEEKSLEQLVIASMAKKPGAK